MSSGADLALLMVSTLEKNKAEVSDDNIGKYYFMVTNSKY